ncbi:MAG: glycosyltransferase family 2 protein [Verrucomicrobia bacterium]|nr:MAG: glycosyltransferase family 2 protein [Verrucomicrobiota bacterium]
MMDAGGTADRVRPLFTVVVPFLNEEKALRACLDSLRAQSFPASDFELVFVDNGSTDGSAAIVRAHGGVRLLSEERRDPYLARNRGIAAARGRYIVFLDADCIAAADWLEAMGREVRRDDPAVLVGYLAYPAGTGGVLRLFEAYEDFKLRRVYDGGLAEFRFGHAGNMAVRADVFAELGPFPAMPVVGDSEILHRVSARWPDAPIRYARSARVVHAEVRDFRGCLAKLFEAGAHSETLARVSPYRMLPLAERWRVFSECAAALRFGPALRLALSGTLLLGWVAFAAGRASRALGIAAGRSPAVVPEKPANPGNRGCVR